MRLPVVCASLRGYMRISSLIVRNFRNFSNLTVEFGNHAVIVGPNGVGKSNLLYALRLLLDPSLPDSSRHLRQEDFWDGELRPLSKQARIEISVELTDFEEDDDQLASLAEFLVESEPMVARLTYLFRAKGSAAEEPTSDDFEFLIFGGDREENRVGYEVRRRMPLDLFHALRDAEADLAIWRRSPLRPLLDRAWSQVTKAEKAELAKGIEDATKLVAAAAPLEELAASITGSLSRHAGSHATDVSLGIGPKEAEALVRVVRLLLDRGQRSIGEASLGLANVIFFTLKLLELEQLVDNHERDHTFLAIEEPEAHLHPHLQRQMFRSFLRLRPHLPKPSSHPVQDALPATVLLTTHSPQVASIAPIGSIVLLRQIETKVSRKPKAGEKATVVATVAASAFKADLNDAERDDLERYIEVTRGEIFFARGVLLVEGEAEQYLVPAIARLHEVDLDALGVSVCSVGGTHFESHVRLLRALEIPFAVITDGDPGRTRPGRKRMFELLKLLVSPKAYAALSADDTDEVAAHGLFFGERTFELDLLEGRRKSMPQALRDLAQTNAARIRADGWLADANSLDPEQVLKDIEAIGKGRFAQRLATSLKKSKGVQGPQHVLDAIDFIAKKVGG